MKCPYCEHSETKVLDSRESEDLSATRRRRECEKCEKRFTTYERVELVDLNVIKKDGRKEPFNREKLLRGIVNACQKTSVTKEQAEKLVEEIERDLRQEETIEIPSTKVGELVMRKLKKLDKIAYIRFASVYREFEDLEDFKEELNTLLKKKK